MGGKQPQAPAPPPSPPSPAETSEQAIQAQINAVPKIFETQQQFAPKFAQLELEQLQRFSPEFAKIATDVQGLVAPEITAAQQNLAKFLGETDEQEFESLKPGLIEDVRSAQSVRGIGDVSPLGAIDEAVQIARLKQSLKDRRLNVSLSAAGRQPTSSLSPVSGSPGQLVQNISPESIFSAQGSLNAFNASLFNTQAGIFGAQSQAATQRRAQNIGIISDSIGGGLQLASAGVSMFCWVASELFGGWFESKTVLSRIYIGNYAPKWFKNLYIKHGKRMAEFIKDKPILKNILRPIFEVFVFIGRRQLNG